jgi:replication factor C subunit 3/5
MSTDHTNYHLTYHTLPWIVKYRPENLDNIISQSQVITILKNFMKQKQLPHLLFYGPPGVGKTSTIIALAKELYGDNYPMMTLEINASEERGIEMVRNKITQFASSKNLLMNDDNNMFKIVILDEADALTSDAQASLRRIIEKFSRNTRFCLICNYIKNINTAIQSRCICFRFSPLATEYITTKVNDIVKIEKINITKEGIQTIIKRAGGDMRKVLNTLQAVNMGNISIDKKEKITSQKVNDCLGYPKKSDIDKMLNSIVHDDFKTSMNLLIDIKTQQGYYINDIINEIHEFLINSIYNLKLNTLKLSNDQIVQILSMIANVQYNAAICTNDDILLGSIIGSIKCVLNSQKLVKDM